jgi:DNA-3-methyladenine glycosylase
MLPAKKYSGSGINLKGKSPTEMNSAIRLSRDFFVRDVLLVAPELIGKVIALSSGNNSVRRFMITETEAYRGTEDKACHASKGRSARTDVMFQQGGRIYVYFVYGMYWMLNFVAGEENNPQAALIRGIEGYNGPGKLTRAIGIDKTYYGEDLTISSRIWVEDTGFRTSLKTASRIGINYATEEWKNKPWRYYI